VTSSGFSVEAVPVRGGVPPAGANSIRLGHCARCKKAREGSRAGSKNRAELGPTPASSGPPAWALVCGGGTFGRAVAGWMVVDWGDPESVGGVDG
jgi:hypothetical protein